MILRLWRARLRPGAEPEFLDRLRAMLASQPGPEAPIDFTYGFRHDSGTTSFLSLSVWRDLHTLIAATGGDMTRSVRWIDAEDVTEAWSADAFEALPPEPVPIDRSDGLVLGVVTGIVQANHESLVQAMIDRSVANALGAGAVGAYVGRRMASAAMEIAVVVAWPNRATLARFVRSREVGAIDPGFTAHLSTWRFETYNALAPDRLLVPAAGPAVLVADDEGRYVEASPGTERVLGLPGEMLLGRSVSDQVVSRESVDPLWRDFRSEGNQAGEIELRRQDGGSVRVRYRAATNVPAPGLHASVLELPSDPPDPRPVEEIVREAIGSEAGSAAEAARESSGS